MAAVIETSENNSVELLQTHYYRANYNQLKKAYLEALEKMGHNIISVNDDFNEIFSECGKLEVSAKLIMQTPLETSIDFTINSEYLFGVGKAEKFIQEALSIIEKSVQINGLGLHK